MNPADFSNDGKHFNCSELLQLPFSRLDDHKSVYAIIFTSSMLEDVSDEDITDQ